MSFKERFIGVCIYCLYPNFQFPLCALVLSFIARNFTLSPNRVSGERRMVSIIRLHIAKGNGNEKGKEKDSLGGGCSGGVTIKLTVARTFHMPQSRPPAGLCIESTLSNTCS